MSRPLHLLELDLRWPPETFLRWKLEGLAARGMRVTVASRAIADPAARLRGVELARLPPRGSARAETLAAVDRLVAELCPDVVHVEWMGSATRYLQLFDHWQCPVVISVHGSHISADPHVPGNEGYAAQLPTVLRSASRVHCVSESLWRAVVRLGAEPARARVIRQGVDPSIFKPRTKSGRGSRLRVVSAGWPRWVKGFEWALQAIRLLADGGVPVQFELVGAGGGDPEERARLGHTVEDLGLTDSVTLEAGLPSAGVARRMAASDVLLVSSLDEGLPTVILEAMACGLPVVATDCGGISEALTHGTHGFLVRPRDAAGLADALGRLWREPQLRVALGTAGRRTVTKRFTLARQLDEFMALYEELGREEPARVRAAHAGVSPPMFAHRPQPGPPGTLRVLSACPLRWEQGLEHAVQAISLLREVGVSARYRIVGEGVHLPAVAFARHQLGLSDSVEIVCGTEDRLVQELRDTDLLLDPAVSDAADGRALVAAQAAGVPFVATRRPGLVERGGIIVARRDPTAIAQAIARLGQESVVRELIA